MTEDTIAIPLRISRIDQTREGCADFDLPDGRVRPPLTNRAGAARDRLLELVDIFLERLLVLEGLLQELEEGSQGALLVFGERIENPIADAPVLHQSAILEVDQMAGHVRLGGFHH